MKTESQNKMILDHLKKHKCIMPMEALNLYGVYRLASRINDLRAGGHNIETKMQYLQPVKFAKYVYTKPKVK
jgi:hypothetical protein